MKPFIPERLPPDSLDWTGLIRDIGAANRALAAFDGVLYGLRSAEVLLAPWTTQEAVLSSRIEGTEAGLEEVYRFEAGEPAVTEAKRLDIQEIINYRKALRRAEELLKEKPFGLNAVLDLHSVLLDSVRGATKGRGKFRTTQNWIGRPGSTIEEAVFVPPSPLDLADHLREWERYYHREERDPLVQLALIHAQFEILHPFADGNGRIGRILIPIFLYEKKVIARPCFYLSEYLEAHREEYIMRLRELGQPGSWNRWVEFFLRAITAQAQANSRKARAIQDLYESLKSRALSATRSQYAVPMLDFLFTRPILRSTDLIGRPEMPSTPMVHRMLAQLRTAGVLKLLREKSGPKPQVLALAQLINLCEGREVI